jgi:hypothetical protein
LLQFFNAPELEHASWVAGLTSQVFPRLEDLEDLDIIYAFPLRRERGALVKKACLQCHIEAEFFKKDTSITTI